MNGRRRRNRQPVFAPGAATGLAPAGAEYSYVPLDWLLQHPAARRWWSSSQKTGIGIVEIIDTVVDLSDGFEGIIIHLAVTGKSLSQAGNTGTAWRLFLNRVPYIQTLWHSASADIQDGRFDYLGEGDGLGQSWARMEVWLEENALVEMGMVNNGGTADPMGWSMWGAYWPTTLRDQYDVYRRKGRVG